MKKLLVLTLAILALSGCRIVPKTKVMIVTCPPLFENVEINYELSANRDNRSTIYLVPVPNEDNKNVLLAMPRERCVAFIDG